jgi:enoyl-CoA hydratase/carnithine racemase
MSSEPVLLEIENEIATVTLNQPKRRNPLSRTVTDALDEILQTIRKEDVGCVVIEGNGKAFSAGGDIDEMLDNIESDRSVDEMVQEWELYAETTSRTIADVYNFPLPTVAKIDGPAVGAGANLALACDVKLASGSGSIGFGFRNVGLSVDSGTSYFLPRIVGENVAKELVLTGEMVDAKRAEKIGLVNHVFTEDYDVQCRELVETIATGPSVALRHAARLVGESSHKTLEEAISDEAIAQGIAFTSPAHEAAVRAFKEG